MLESAERGVGVGTGVHDFFAFMTPTRSEKLSRGMDLRASVAFMPFGVGPPGEVTACEDAGGESSRLMRSAIASNSISECE